MDRLLSQNVDLHTSLTVAVGANQPDAVRWLLERLRETHETEHQSPQQAQACLVEALRAMINSEKLNMLRLLSQMWPSWSELEIRLNISDVRLCEFALRGGSTKVARFIINESTPLYWTIKTYHDSFYDFWIAIGQLSLIHI